MTKLDKKLKEIFLSKNSSSIKYLYFFFNKIISLLSFKKSFSQGSMDLILNIIFRDQRSGVYVDVGCQHPIKNNNTFLLYKRGWSGINIDLDRVNIDLFNYHRPRDFNFNSAISDKKEEVDLFYYHQKSPINTLDKEVSNKQPAKLEKTLKIKTETLTDIIEKTTIKNIDILSIDVEGYELKVLKGLNFEKFKPKLIIAEFLDLTATKWEIPYNNLDNVVNSEIYRYMISKNYKLVNWVNGDLIFMIKNSID